MEELEAALARSLNNQRILQENLAYMLETEATLRNYID
jgi:hypothetical protein